MQSETFELKTSPPTTVKVEWNPEFDDVRVYVQEQQVGEFKSHKDFLDGRSFPIAGHGEIHVQWQQSLGKRVGVRLLHNGVEVLLPGEVPDREKVYRDSSNTLFFFGGISVVAAIIAVVNPQMEYPTLMMVSIGVMGLGMLGLAVLVRRGSRAALAGAAALYAAQTVVAIASQLSAGRQVATLSSVFRVVMLYLLVRPVFQLQMIEQKSSGSHPYR